MIACELCSGRHPTNRCSQGLAWVEQCFEGTVGDSPVRLIADANVIPLFTTGRRSAPFGGREAALESQRSIDRRRRAG